MAVRLPKELVDRFGLREGGEIDTAGIETMLEDSVEEAASKRREEALEAIKARAWIPEGFRFNREEHYDEEMDERHGRVWR